MTILEELWSGMLSAGGKNYYLGEDIKEATAKAAAAVSYTHLTLPTICSV